MQTYDHCKTQLFTLIGRRIVLHRPHAGCTEGVIVEKIGPARFGCHLQHPNGHPYKPAATGCGVVDFHRSEFKLPPLPRDERPPVFLEDDSDGFAYADEPNF